MQMTTNIDVTVRITKPGGQYKFEFLSTSSHIEQHGHAWLLNVKLDARFTFTVAGLYTFDPIVPIYISPDATHKSVISTYSGQFSVPVLSNNHKVLSFYDKNSDHHYYYYTLRFKDQHGVAFQTPDPMIINK
jgi:hypothetical protein